MNTLQSSHKINLIFFSASIIFLFTTSVFPQFSESVVKTDYSKNKKKSVTKISLSDPDEKPHKLVGGYYNVTGQYKSKLLLNNKGGYPVEVQPTIYSKDGSVLQIPPITVEGESHRYIDIADWANQGGANYKEGNLELFHRGNDLIIGSQIYITNESKSLGFESKLSELGKFDSRQLEGVLWNPSDSTETDVALTNTSDEYLTVTANLTKKNGTSNQPQTIILLPHETKILNIRNDFNQGNNFANRNILGLSFSHEGPKDALLVWAMTKDESTGYSNVINFKNPNSIKSKQYHGAGLQLGKINDDKLKPIVVIRNTSNKQVKVKIRVPYTEENGNKRKVRLEPITLAPKELQKVDMQEVIQLKNIKTAGIEIKYTGRIGSVIAVAQSVSQSKTQVFRTILWDILGHRSATGGYPFDIDGSSNSVAYIKNATDREQKYFAYLLYGEREVYVIKSDKLTHHETIEIDVKKLRDEQIPDIWGNKLPLTVTKGQLSWSGIPAIENEEAEIPDDLGIIGQMEQVNLEKGINASYYCQYCCPMAHDDRYPFLPRIIPNNKEIVYGEQSTINYNVSAFRITSCYNGTTNVPVIEEAVWSIVDSSIGNINSSTGE